MNSPSYPEAAVGIEAEVFSLFPYGIIVLDGAGAVVAANRQADALLRRPGLGGGTGSTRCCDLFGCRHPATPLRDMCLTELVVGAHRALPELRLDLPGDETRAVWLTAAPLERESKRMVVQIRGGDCHDRRRRTNPHWIGDRQLRISAFGCTRLESREGSISGAWLGHRSGQILKYLVCHRQRVATSEELADAIWPDAGRAGLISVRHFVHELRHHLEPDRRKRTPSAFVLSRQGGYVLDRSRVHIDVDDFLEGVHAGKTAFASDDFDAARAHLEWSMSLYVGDLFAEDPYELWTIDERDRLRDVAIEALRMLLELAQAEGDFESAHEHLKRLTALEPLDMELQRCLIENCLRRGRRSEASRRYSLLRKRMLHEFGEELDFNLRDLLREPSSLSPSRLRTLISPP